MAPSSVHPLSIHPLRPQHLPTVTPAANKQQRTLPKTAGSKPRDFSIYIDQHSSSAELHPQPTRSVIKTNQAPSHPYSTLAKKSGNPLLGTATKKTSQKPLEDTTNTVRKKLSRVRINDPQEKSPAKHQSVKPAISNNTSSIPRKNPSTSQILLTPNANKSIKVKKSPSLNQLSALNNDPSKRLLYRTPVTSKRASRPPLANASGCGINDDDDNEEVSFVTSDNSIDHLDFDLTQENIPDVEYGPPSAIIEPVESLMDEQEYEKSESTMREFFKNVKEEPSNYLISEYGQRSYDASRDDMVKEIKAIIISDGSKEKWTCEPICEMTNYAVDNLLEEFHIPSGPIRHASKPVTIRQKKLPVMSFSSRDSRPIAPRSYSSSHLRGTTKPPTLIPPRSKTHLLPPSTRHSTKNLAKVSCPTLKTTSQPPGTPASLAQYQHLVQSLIHDHHSKFFSDLDLLHSDFEDTSDLIGQDLSSLQLDLVV